MSICYPLQDMQNRMNMTHSVVLKWWVLLVSKTCWHLIEHLISNPFVVVLFEKFNPTVYTRTPDIGTTVILDFMTPFDFMKCSKIKFIQSKMFFLLHKVWWSKFLKWLIFYTPHFPIILKVPLKRGTLHMVTEVNSSRALY